MAARRPSTKYGGKSFQIVALKRSSAAQLHNSVTRIAGQFASMGYELRTAHQKMVDDLNTLALGNLEDYTKAGGRPQKKDGQLRNVLKNDRISSVGNSGFQWGIVERLNNSGAGLYWRGIEQGSRVFVGREVRVLWFRGFGKGGKSLPPLQSRYPKDARMLQVGGRAPLVTINRPIEASHFLSDAAEQFERDGIWEREIANASAAWERVMAGAASGGRRAGSIRQGLTG